MSTISPSKDKSDLSWRGTYIKSYNFIENGFHFIWSQKFTMEFFALEEGSLRQDSVDPLN